MKDLCLGKAPSIVKENPRIVDVEQTHNGIKRMKIRCDLCGRRVTASVRPSHDDVTVLVFTLPPHKPKGWWKNRGRKANRNSPNR